MKTWINVPVLFIVASSCVFIAIKTLKYLQFVAEQRRIERSRAIELGQEPPRDKMWDALTCIAIGGGVPAAGFFFGWLTTTDHPATTEPVWSTVTAVGIIAFFFGTMLALGILHEPAPKPDKSAKKSRNAKRLNADYDPEFDQTSDIGI